MRRAPGTGSIEPAPGGGFWPRLPDRKRLRRVATTEEAGRLLDAALAELASGEHIDRAGLTLGSWGTTVLDRREREGLRSVQTERSRWRQHVEAHQIAALPVAEVSRGAVRSWLDGLMRKRAAPGRGHSTVRERPLARHTVQNTLGLMRIVLGAAVDRELIAVNPARDVRLPRSAGTTHEPWTYLLPDEQERLLAVLPLDQRSLVAFALGTGMRQGEIWNLELRDVAGDVVTVRYGSRGAATKSGKVRRVPLFGLAREALDAWLPELAKQPNPHKLVWPLPSGYRRQKGKAPSWWSEAMRAANLAPEGRHDGQAVRWHDLRHTCASSLIAGWWGRRWSLEEIRQLLGHSAVAVTERYAHLAESALAEAARATPAVQRIPRESHGDGAESQNPLAPPARVELTTNGLGMRSHPEPERAVSSVCGTIMGLAVAGLEALAGGEPHAVAVATRALAQIARLARGDLADDEPAVAGARAR
jgi:integrase